ncbi:MAG: hypothetical protein FJ014_19565 [Chloroflexi bacterium]|nr:hypothetical protein [Chloroflexota bacterium]
MHPGLACSDGGYSYQVAWARLHDVSPSTDRFVISCFANIRELPADIFAAHGYIRQEKCVIEHILLAGSEGGD